MIDLISSFLALVGLFSSLDLDYERIYRHIVFNKVLERKKYVYYPTVMFHKIGKEDKNLGPIIYKLTYSDKKLEKLLKLLKQNSYKTLTFQDLLLIKYGIKKIPKKGVILTFDDGYKSMYTKVLPLFKKYKVKGVFFIISEKIGKDGYLNQKEINKLIKYGNEIASHSFSHTNLNYIGGKKLYKEIIKSKEYLEKIFNIKVISFSYPYGMHSKTAIKLVSKNYIFARETKPYKNKPKNQWLIGTIDTYSHPTAKKLFNLIDSFQFGNG